MTACLLTPALRPIFDQVVAGQRVTDDEALRLYGSNDLNGLGAIANVLRERKNGNVATYIHNQHQLREPLHPRVSSARSARKSARRTPLR